MQWKERNPTNTSRRSPLLPVQKRGLLKREKLIQLQHSSKLYVAHIWLKDHVFISTLLAMSCIPTSRLLQHWGFFWGSSLKNFNSFMLLYVQSVVKYIFQVFLFRVPLEHSRPFFLKFYMPPVSGNILAPLHGFNGHDREYALKVNTTSVRNWTC